jgi:hypothetical protein
VRTSKFFDDKTQESTAVIIFEIEKGAVKSVGFAERMKPVCTWNGVPADTTTGDKNAEQSHPPEPAASSVSNGESSLPAR